MKPRDLELLSSYLDGQLSPSDVTRLETRLRTEPQLADVLTDLRATRNLLRKLPKRRAPRNFTLTRKMVGQNPPLPRTYPLFRFASALATLLFFFSFGFNAVGRMAAQPPVFGMGGGGGGADPELEQSVESYSAAEAPAAALAETEAPAEDAFGTQMLPQPTMMPEPSDMARIEGTPTQKEAAGNAAADETSMLVEPETASAPAPLISNVWQIGLAVIALFSAALMVLVRRLAASRWK